MSLFHNETNNVHILCEVLLYCSNPLLYTLQQDSPTCKLHVACGSVFIAHSLTKISYVMQTLRDVCIPHITDKHVTTSA
jgi:hypothetical protein